MQDNNKDFKEYLKTLPLEIRQAIFSIDYPKKLQDVVRNNKLMIDQAGKLEAETTLVMAGIEPLDKYVGNLRENVGLSSIQASVVAHDVNELIFKNIRESLKKINDQIAQEDKIIAGTEETKEPTKEDVLSTIENPQNIDRSEKSVSISSLPSNNSAQETHEEIDKGVSIKINNLPEIAPKYSLSTLSGSKAVPFHQNVSPVNNIVESKLSSDTVVPKKNIIIEEKTRLPEKSKPSFDIPKVDRSAGDPYREPIK